MSQRSSTFGPGAGAVTAAFVVLICGTILAGRVMTTQEAQADGQGSVLQGVRSIEAEFGVVNNEAALEVKEGLFQRIRERRAQRVSQRAASLNQRVAGYRTPTVSQCAPTYAYTSRPAAQAYVHPQYVYVPENVYPSEYQAVVETPSNNRVVAPVVPINASEPMGDCRDGSCSLINGLRIRNSK